MKIKNNKKKGKMYILNKYNCFLPEEILRPIKMICIKRLIIERKQNWFVGFKVAVMDQK